MKLTFSMKMVRTVLAGLAIVTFASIASAQCGPGKGTKAAPGDPTANAIIALETRVLDAIKSRNEAAFRALVDVNGTVVDSMGIRMISSVVPGLFSKDLTFSQYTLEDPKVTLLGTNAAMIVYKSTATATFNGKTTTGVSFETTVYVKRMGKWIGTFHQSSEMANATDSMSGDK